MEKKNNNGTGCIIAFFIIFIIVALIFGISSIIETKDNTNKMEHESKLREEGKVISAQKVTEEVVKSLKNKNYSEISKYLYEGCDFYNNEGEQRNIDLCFEGIQEYTTCRLEKRGNDLENQITYRIYWNGSDYKDAPQLITLFMKKEVKEDEIVYKIHKIIFTDNS